MERSEVLAAGAWWHGARPVWGTPYNSGDEFSLSSVESPRRSGAQGSEGGASPKGQRGGQTDHHLYLPFVLARNMAMVTVAPAACIAAMKAADDCPVV